jgi:predicted ATPase
MPKIILKNIEFSTPKFRKLGGFKIDIAKRLTIIAGHNGIGKSTIIGLIANSSGYSKTIPKSYFDSAYQPNFHELFHLSTEFDYFEKFSDKPSVILEYTIDSATLHKKCNVTSHTEKNGQKRLKVVPRTVEKEIGEQTEIRDAGKVPIPTLYLGMSRMTPIGEHSKESIQKKFLKSFNQKDADYIREKFKQVIDFTDAEQTGIVSHQFKASKKSSKLPNMNHDSLSISLGQDSLGSIITALASFNQLERDDAEYTGGILVIDEIDAGFHPHAQMSIIKLLKKEAKRLSLQVIATSHSLTVIKEVLVEKDEFSKREVIDNVIYLMNTASPILMPAPTYPKIKADMLLEDTCEEVIKNKVKIYFEDDEAKYVFEKIYDTQNSKINCELILISAKTGCSQLLGLAKADDYFQTVIIVFDNDVMTSESNRRLIEEHDNFIALPASNEFTEMTKADERTPEAIIKKQIEKVVNYHEDYAELWKKAAVTHSLSSDKVKLDIALTDEDKDSRLRVKNKNWFKRCKLHIERLNIVDLWAKENAIQVEEFRNKIEVAINHILNQERKT